MQIMIDHESQLDHFILSCINNSHWSSWLSDLKQGVRLQESQVVKVNNLVLKFKMGHLYLKQVGLLVVVVWANRNDLAFFHNRFFAIFGLIKSDLVMYKVKHCIINPSLYLFLRLAFDALTILWDAT